MCIFHTLWDLNTIFVGHLSDPLLHCGQYDVFLQGVLKTQLEVCVEQIQEVFCHCLVIGGIKCIVQLQLIHNLGVDGVNGEVCMFQHNI